VCALNNPASTTSHRHDVIQITLQVFSSLGVKSENHDKTSDIFPSATSSVIINSSATPHSFDHGENE
jgi:hypothetical protein